jgi:hypothetical protein
MTMRSYVMQLVMHHTFSLELSQIDTPLGSVMKRAVLQLHASPDEALAPPQAHNLHVHCALLLTHVSCLWANCYMHDLNMSNQNDYEAIVSFMMSTERKYLGACKPY